MQPELITALAALGGAAVGGLTTVWATHWTNRAAADRERAQRLHDQRQHTYTEAQEAVASFVALRLNTSVLFSMRSTMGTEHGLRMREAAVRVQVLIPALEEPVVTYLRSYNPENRDYQVEMRADFMRAAIIELDKLRPE